MHLPAALGAILLAFPELRTCNIAHDLLSCLHIIVSSFAARFAGLLIPFSINIADWFS